MGGSAGPHFALANVLNGATNLWQNWEFKRSTRHFRFSFVTLVLQTSSRNASPEIGSGSGSHTHLKKFMRLLSVHWSSFPQLKLVEPVGTLPHQPACKAGALLVCHDPK